MYKKIWLFAFSFVLLVSGLYPIQSTAASIGFQKEGQLLSKKLSAVVIKDIAFDWTKPSGGAYPDLKANNKVAIYVSMAAQRVKIMQDDKVIYTMVTSSGVDGSKATSTPRGHYKIENEHGKWFYSPKYQEGAKYWTSWKNHGEFLFHSVPMDASGNVKVKEAMKLGKEASHGCFRLTIPDAKWINEHIPVGTDVYIR